MYVQADQDFRRRPEDIGRYYLRTPTGKMVRMDSVVTIASTTAPQVISHFNLFRSTEINGRAAPGFSSGQALQAMDALARRNLPLGMSYDWSGLSREELQSGGQAVPHLRPRPAAGVSHAGRPVREPGAAVHHPAVGAARGARRAGRSVGARADQRRLLPDRPGDAHRPVGQERHPDRRVRRAAAAARAWASSTRPSRPRGFACGRS